MIQYKYNFSIIMSIYDVEEYLEEAIDSIIQQSLDFEENVQLIFVNDGSTDESGEICKKYANQYPDNIEYHEKSNGGLSSARNFGLNFVRGRYVNFFDPDDILSKDALKSVYNFFEQNSDINLAGLVVEYFEGKTGVHPRYEKFGKETTVVNLDESPQNYILSSAATFYKSNIFDNIKFDTNLEVAEDLFANCQIYFDNRHIGIIGHDEAVYNYRIRKEASSLSGKTKYNIDSFIANTRYLYENFCRILNEKNMQMPEFLKYILLGEIKKRNKALNGEKSEKILIFHELCKDILSKIEDKYIVNFYDKNHMIKIAFFTLKYGFDSKSIEFKIHDHILYANSVKIGTVNECKIILSNYEVTDNVIKFIGVYNDVLPINVNGSVKFKDKRGKTYNIILNKSENKFFLNKVLGMEFNTTYKFETELPIDNLTSYRPILKVAGIEIPIKFVNMDKNYVVEDYLRKEEEYSFINKTRVISFTNKGIDIKKRSFLSKIMYEIKRIGYIKQFFNVNWVYRLFARTNKRYVLFNDRPLVGNDNAQALFEYVCKNEKKFARNSYFVISKDSKNIKEIKKIGKVIIKDSFLHKIMFLNSKIIISSHANFYNPFSITETECFEDLFAYKLVFLQHGVIMNDVHRPLNKCKSKIDMFVTSTKKEYEEINTNKYMFDKEVVLTGLPRFDKLNDKKEKMILIAPTWRTYLSGPINSEGFHDIKDDFDNSEYYKRYSNLLSNEKMLKELKNKGYKILFLLHPGFKLYESFFKRLENDIVEIKNVENIKYSEIFEKLSLLITDYSSIIFDVAYLKKPMFLYQFDSEEYFTNHYKPGYFSYEKDGFGKIIKDEDELVKSIIKQVNSDEKMEDIYLERINNTFLNVDKNNSKRVFEKIKEIIIK